MIVWCQKCNTHPCEISTDNATTLTVDMLRPECPPCRGYASVQRIWRNLQEILDLPDLI